MRKPSEGTVFIGGMFALAIWVFAVLPWLYGPPPRFAESDHPPQTHSAAAQQKATAKPDGSETAPFFIRIPKSAEEAANEAEDRKDKASTDRWLTWFTGAVALFTLMLVVATALLYSAGEKQLRAASESFNKINRPYVFVFGVKNIEPGPTEHLDGLVPYIVANHGQAPALIDRVEYCLSCGTEPKATGAAWDDHPLVVSPILSVNDQVSTKAQSVEWIDSGARIVDLQTSQNWAIPEVKIPGTTWFFWVKVFYRGPFSVGHETSGCWQYDREPCQFIQFGGTKYNYTK